MLFLSYAYIMAASCSVYSIYIVRVFIFLSNNVKNNNNERVRWRIYVRPLPIYLYHVGLDEIGDSFFCGHKQEAAPSSR